MKNKRLFIGVPIPHAFKKEIETWEKKQLFYHNLRWVSLNNLHITILFLGNIPENNIAEISNKIKQVAKSINPFYIKFNRFTYFPQNDDAKMIWGQFEICNSLLKLQESIKRVLDLDDEDQSQSFMPHVTLARIKNHSTPLKEENKKMKDMLVENIILWESSLENTQTKYLSLESHDLGMIR